MSLSAGEKLGPYEILAPIGAGGMGEVYRARDPRLGREVAIKVSAERFSERFEREARAIASLNHPNICHLYDVGPNYLVMELIEGSTLADRLRQGAISLDEALNLARQIAEALEAAHEKGIVHRDLKPGNVKVKADGLVKVLDFGLAKTGGTPALPSEESPTLTVAQTEAGMILGTASYMAPEQAKGQPVDKRADIYAFGAVLYEMLTGRRLHKGETTTEVLASVIKEEPRWEGVPQQARRLLQRCLEKDRQKRLRHIGDVMALVDESPAPPATPLAPQAGGKWLWPAIGAGVAIAAIALALWAPWKKPAPAQAARFEVGPAEKMTFIPGGDMAVSPDGRWMVFPAIGEDGRTRYYIRALDGVEARALPGTESPTLAPPPAAWSYDSHWVIFAFNDGKLKKVNIQGGPAQTIGDFPGYLNGAGWNADGVIVAGTTAPGSPIYRISAAGGQVTPLTALAPTETVHNWPQLLPDGKHFLYQRVSPDAARGGVYAGSIDLPPNRQSTYRLLASDNQAYFAPAPGGGTGHLLFLRQSTLMAQPFDPDKLTFSGEAVAIAESVDVFPIRNAGLFSVSNNGTLVYREGAGLQTALTWIDQQGNRAGILGDAASDYSQLAISPDGRRVAATRGTAASSNIWILDVADGRSTRFTFDPNRDDSPVWSPDGKSIVFSSNRGGQFALYIKPADNSSEEKVLVRTSEPNGATGWTNDGRFLVFTSTNGRTANDIWALPYPGESKPIPLLQTPFDESQARVSPDSKWLAYASNESGPTEIYVRPFTPQTPGTGAKWLVSNGGGFLPLWRPDGKELFYRSSSGQIMAVDVNAGTGFRAGTPRRLFGSPAVRGNWDISPDGKRFLFVASPNASRTIPFTVVLNWAAQLKK